MVSSLVSRLHSVLPGLRRKHTAAFCGSGWGYRNYTRTVCRVLDGYLADCIVYMYMYIVQAYTVQIFVGQ